MSRRDYDWPVEAIPHDLEAAWPVEVRDAYRSLWRLTGTPPSVTERYGDWVIEAGHRRVPSHGRIILPKDGSR